MRMEWTPEKIQVLRDHYNNGEYNAARLGELIGTTKNSVISKANRLNLNLPKPANINITIETKPVSLQTMTHRECQYPYGHPGDDDFRFCGDPVDKESYCQTHHDLCYRTVEEE